MELHAGKEAVEVSSRYEEVGWEEVEIEERSGDGGEIREGRLRETASEEKCKF